MNVAQKLKSVGIKVKHYKKGPLGKDNFSMSIKNDTLFLWEGSANIKVRTNKSKRQCLINVEEPSRTIVSKIRASHAFDRLDNSIKLSHNQKLDSIEEANIYAPIHNPNRWDCSVIVPNSRFSVKFLDAIVKKHPYTQIESRWEARQTSRKTNLTFLVGYDESSSKKPFICLLKDNVDSFEDAYKSLLPVDVKLKADHKRQGEWFFNPVDNKLNNELLTYAALNPAKFKKSRLNGAKKTRYGWNRTPSSHEAHCVLFKGKRYAIGVVKETRKGRHEPITLDKFHEVVRNNEAVKPETTRSRNWD